MNEAIQVTIIMYFSFGAKNEDVIFETYLKNNNRLFTSPNYLN